MTNWKLMYPDIILQIFKIGFVKIHKSWRFLAIGKAQQIPVLGFVKREIFRKYPDVVDVTQLCKMLGGSRPVSKKTAYRLLTSGKIKAFRLGRSYRIPKVNVIRFLQNGLSDECNTDDFLIDSVEE